MYSNRLKLFSIVKNFTILLFYCIFHQIIRGFFQQHLEFHKVSNELFSESFDPVHKNSFNDSNQTDLFNSLV